MTTNYIEIPVLARFTFKDEKTAVSFNFGTCLSHWVSGTTRYKFGYFDESNTYKINDNVPTITTTVISTDATSTYYTYGDQRWDFGLTLGLITGFYLDKGFFFWMPVIH